MNMQRGEELAAGGPLDLPPYTLQMEGRSPGKPGRSLRRDLGRNLHPEQSP